MVCSRKPAGSTQNAGILAYQDDDNFVKLVYKAATGRRGMGGPVAATPAVQPGTVDIIIESRGTQQTAATLSLADIIKDNNTLVLKLDKKGSVYTASCSSDGKSFKVVGTADIMLKDVKAGIVVCDGVPPTGRGNQGFPQQAGQVDTTPFEVAYDHFHIVNKGLK
jgi:beta-glucosidase